MLGFRGCTQYEDSRHLTVRCVDPQSNVELFSWWILTGENHGKSPLISPPFLERISVELFVQATKQQANPSVYHNRFCVYSPTKMHQNPKRKFNWRSLGLLRNRSRKQTVTSTLHNKNPLTTTLKTLRFLRVNDLLGKSEALQVMVWKLGGFLDGSGQIWSTL